MSGRPYGNTHKKKACGMLVLTGFVINRFSISQFRTAKRHATRFLYDPYMIKIQTVM